MEDKKAFLYIVRHIGRTSRLVGISFGVIHAETNEEATRRLIEKMGDNAYSFNLLDATADNCEGYIGIPSGDLLAFEAR